MKIKRYFAKDMKTALSQVKEELGADAVIMSNKKVTGGVEIVAAIDSLDTEADVKSTKSHSEIKINFGQTKNTQKSNSSKDTYQGKQAKKAFSSILQNETRGNNDSLGALLERQNKFSNNREKSLRRQDKPTYLTSDEEYEKLKKGRSSFGKSGYRKKAKETDTKFNWSREKRVESPLKQPKQASFTPDKSAEIEEMKNEMQSIRQLLEHQLSGLMRQEVERREPLRGMLIKRLEKMGFATDVADQLAYYIPEKTPVAEAWRTVLSILSDQILTQDPYSSNSGGVIALLGPTGVGKTTTIAKLAARAAMDYGADEVALVTTDTYRIGAQEQLATYGKIMGCPVKLARSADELSEILYQFRHRRFVLIDTAGMGQRDIRLQEQLDTIIGRNGKEIRSYLVLPATAQRRVLQETIDQFKRIPLSGCVLSKLDESLSLGELISVTIQNALPIAYLADGQRVPEDLQAATGNYLVSRANELLQEELKRNQHFLTTEPSDL